jgi:hypothetical protein
MSKKNELLKECLKVMQDPSVEKWYSENLAKKPQIETIRILEQAVLSEDITVKAALCIALVVGFQWDVKFKGVQ